MGIVLSLGRLLLEQKFEEPPALCGGVSVFQAISVNLTKERRYSYYN